MAAEDAPFDAVDWSAVEGGSRLRRRTVAFALAMAAVAAAVTYDFVVVPAGEPTLPWWDVTGLDWLFVVTWLVVATFGVAPLVARPRLTAFYWQRLRRQPVTLGCLVVIGCFVLVGSVGPLVVPRPELNIQHAFQPPAWMAIDVGYVTNCVGPVRDGRCHGTWQHPLGTTNGGRDVLAYVVHGTRIAVAVALLSSALLVPLGTAVGATAAYRGGWTDELLMRFVDLVQAVPAFLVYLVVVFLLEPNIFLLVVLFGVTSWGGVARLVRAEALGVGETGYVRAAESAGAGSRHVLRRHLLPNVAATVLAATAMQIPTLVLTEAALSFLGRGAELSLSWGQLMKAGFEYLPSYWWISTAPAIALSLTALAFNVFADGLRDVLDPREEL